MAKQSLNTIKNWFKTGFKPTQQQFWDTWDSFWHKDEVIPAANIENLDIRFSEKADAEVLSSHLTDQKAHGLDRKAGLEEKNVFTADNIFEKDIRVERVKTGTGVDFNLDLYGKISEPGFASWFNFGIGDGSLSLVTTAPNQEPDEPPFYRGTQLTINNAGDMAISGSLTANELLLNTTDNFHQTIKPATVVTEDTELILPALSGTLARTADIPTIIAGTNISLTGTYPNVIINAKGGGGSAGISAVTYDELMNLRESETLIPGQEYLITDFQSTFVYAVHTIYPASGEDPSTEYLNYGSEVYSGPVEPLIVTAISPRVIHSVAKSVVYEDDVITYNPDNIYSGLWASTKGTIVRRTDTRQNNTADFDYRVTMYKTNGAEPQRALNLSSNCTIRAQGQYGMLVPVVVGDMKNSILNSFLGDIMFSLQNSTLDMRYGRIYSSNLGVYGCDIKGCLLYMNHYYEKWMVSLGSIYARVGMDRRPIGGETVTTHLANKYSSVYVVESNDAKLYMVNTGPEGITTTELP